MQDYAKASTIRYSTWIEAGNFLTFSRFMGASGTNILKAGQREKSSESGIVPPKAGRLECMQLELLTHKCENIKCFYWYANSGLHRRLHKPIVAYKRNDNIRSLIGQHRISIRKSYCTKESAHHAERVIFVANSSKKHLRTGNKKVFKIFH